MSTELTSRFVRDLPPGEGYADRLAQELRLIEHHRLVPLFCQVQDIIRLIPDIPHNIRGSAGSSLVCYLLGISHIDPLEWGLGLARFIHDLRPDMPDIDIDVPWNRRDEVWARVFGKYGRRAARVSNKVMWKERSIYREAQRRYGPEPTDNEIEIVTNHLLGEQRCWSLHCGGVVIGDEPWAEEELLSPFQLSWDKDDVERKGRYKIDILSSRALGQLADLSDRPLFDYPHADEDTAALWRRGDGIGVTGGESPAFRKAAMGLEVTDRYDVILASALIRPAAASGTRSVPFFDAWRQRREQTSLVFDDDCITAIADRLDVTPGKADMIRRDIVKGRIAVPEALADIGEFTAYSFCKSHAIAYGAVVWALSWHKVRRPAAFWQAALDNCQSMYRHWVHIREGIRAGLEVERQRRLFPVSADDEFRSKGYWTSPDELSGLLDRPVGKRVFFRGVIGAFRAYRPRLNKEAHPITFVTIWTGERYRQLVLSGAVNLRREDFIEGVGTMEVVQNADHLNVQQYRLYNKNDTQMRFRGF